MTTPNETNNLQLFDNSRLSDHKLCPRYFYWRHRRHFTTPAMKPSLDFGTSWHAAMDVVWTLLSQDKPNEEVVAASLEAFARSWLDLGYALDPSSAELDAIGFRNLNTALEMLHFYVPARRNFVSSHELVQAERPFCVPLDPNNPDLFYVGRIDKVVKNKSTGKLHGIEHKTSSEYAKEGIFKESYKTSFSGPNSQIDGYTHALKCDFGNDVVSIYADLVLVHKNVHDGFMLMEIKRRTDDLEAWLWEVHDEISAIEKNDRALAIAESTPDASYLAAFPKRTINCINKYGTCPYLSLCMGHTNPLRYQSPPAGFAVKKWEPFEELRLAELGLANPEENKA